MVWDIICFSSTDWHGTWGSRQQIMTGLGQLGHRTLFVERPVGPEHLLRYPEWRLRKWRRWKEGLVEVINNVWIASLLPLFPGRYQTVSVSRLNRHLIVPQVRNWLDRLALSDPILWLYLSDAAPLLGAFGESLTVYHCIDEMTVGTRGHKRRAISAMERDLLRRVDLVFANSLPIYESKRKYNQNTFRVPSGANLDLFAPAPGRVIHPLLQKIPAPRIGYSGHVNDRLDYDLLLYIAKERPYWSFVFFGNTHPWTEQSRPLARLLSLPNTYYLGQHPFAEVPHLLQGMDVCLLPYHQGERGYFRSPLKLYEYLAAGKGVVSVDHPEAREFDSVVGVASSKEEFLSVLDKAMSEHDDTAAGRRIAAVQGHSWDCRVNQMERLIEEALLKRSATQT